MKGTETAMVILEMKRRGGGSQRFKPRELFPLSENLVATDKGNVDLLLQQPNTIHV